MAGLGTYFALIMVVAAFLLWRGKLFQTRWVLWPLLLSFPLPYIADTAGWMTAELGRQPWWAVGMCLALIYFIIVYRMFRGKVSLEGGGYGH